MTKLFSDLSLNEADLTAGVDEVGRGPLAGPVVSCACTYKNYEIDKKFIDKIDDSKKISYKNRIKIFKIIQYLKDNKEINYSLGFATVEEIDSLTGPIIGRPKSATFRTSDLVGLDTLNSVAKGVYDNCLDDEQREIFNLPPFINKMLEKKWLGDKTKQGFYKKVEKVDQERSI